jgi:hypothetical protein
MVPAPSEPGRNVQPETLAQGTSLDDRYRLEEQVGAAEGCTLWRALDTVLSRRVAIRILDAASPRAAAVLDAAKAASIVGDPRLVRVLDAAESDGVVYVVTEWVEGVSLADLLESGPLDPGEAAHVVGEVADTVATAHQAGVPHLRVHPRNVIRSRTGEVRVTGLGVAAAHAGVTTPDPARTDARSLGLLLYAALTARWPGGPGFGLAAAPVDEGEACTPRQVLAGVPTQLDTLTSRAMEDHPRRGGQPLTHPAEVAAALAEVPRGAGSQSTMALPLTAPPPPEPTPTAPAWQGDGRGEAWPPAAAPPAPSRRSSPPPNRGTVAARRGLVAVIVVAVLVAVWQVALEAVRPSPAPEESAGPSATATGPSPGAVVTPAGVTDFDPEGEDGSEYPEDAPLAIDGDPATSWQTSSYYNRSDLGGLKSGVGLLVDLGATKRVGSVDVSVSGDGTDLEIRGATSQGETQDDYRVLAKTQDATGTTTLEPDSPVRTRYVLVWLTDLPPEDGNYRGRIAEITVHS